MDLLLIGGAGYVGSTALRVLRAKGHDCAVLDDLSTGHRAVLDGAEIIEGSYFDRDLLERQLKRGRCDAVLHFAARALEKGDAPQLGALMNEAQALFDRCVGPHSPGQLDSPCCIRCWPPRLSSRTSMAARA